MAGLAAAEPAQPPRSRVCSSADGTITLLLTPQCSVSAFLSPHREESLASCVNGLCEMTNAMIQ